MVEAELSAEQREALNEFYAPQFYTREVREILDLTRMQVDHLAKKLKMSDWHPGSHDVRLASIWHLYTLALGRRVDGRVPREALRHLPPLAEIIGVGAFVKPEVRTSPITLTGYVGLDGGFWWALEIAGEKPPGTPPPAPGTDALVIAAGAVLGKLLQRVCERLADPARLPPPDAFERQPSVELAAAADALRRVEAAAGGARAA